MAQNFKSTRFTHETWKCKDASEKDWLQYQELLNSNLANVITEYPLLTAENPVINYVTVTQEYINALWQKLYQAVMDAATMSIGKKLMKPEHKFWFNNPEVHRLLKEQRKLHNKYDKVRSSTSNLDRINEAKQKFYEARHKFKQGIIKLRQESWSKLISQLHSGADEKTRNRVQWQIWKRAVKKESCADLSKINNMNTNVTPETTLDSLNNLAEYFASISTSSLSSSSQAAIAVISSNNQNNQAENPVDDESITFDKIEEACLNIPTDTALGFDDFSPYFLKHGTQLLFQCLFRFLDLSYQSGFIPHDWTRSNVFALHKSGDKHLAKNFRPISLTPIILRLYERLLVDKITNVLTRNNILNRYQAGFRAKYSTADNLYWFTHLLNKKFNVKKRRYLKPLYPVAFLDLSKAFDKLNINVLLKKVHHCGIKGNLFNFLKSFLSNRLIRTICYDKYSDWYQINCGTPQGSVIGPILFSIYINDLLDEITNHTKVIPSDDICLLPSQTNDSLEPKFVRRSDDT